jgi:hypothetical protein
MAHTYTYIQHLDIEMLHYLDGKEIALSVKGTYNMQSSSFSGTHVHFI